MMEQHGATQNTQSWMDGQCCGVLWSQQTIFSFVFTAGTFCAIAASDTVYTLACFEVSRDCEL
jgi:hypothetical protein